MVIQSFDHYTVRSADLEASRRFYGDVLGLRCETLEAFGLDILHVFLADQAIVHVLKAGPGLDAFMQRSAPSYQQGVERRTGNLEHIALNATGLSEMRQRLHALGFAFRERPLGDSHQVLLDDPDGIEIEINFPAAEAR